MRGPAPRNATAWFLANMDQPIGRSNVFTEAKTTK
jgi:hypothetical protein